jgi:hypothetical protein
MLESRTRVGTEVVLFLATNLCQVVHTKRGSRGRKRRPSYLQETFETDHEISKIGKTFEIDRES